MRHDWVVSMETTSWRSLFYVFFLLSIGCRGEEENPRIVEHPTDHYVAKNEPAKLHCKAEGDPTPEITWYRNGQRVITNKEDQNTHRLLLNGGNQLFFLRIIHSKNQKPDVGTYYCNATNIHGSAISRNATLQIAVLRDDFRESPESVTVSAGELAVFRCRPPRGEPEPKVLWHREGIPVNPDSRVVVSAEGDLSISAVKVADAGKYTCLAINQGGEKESNPATLTVLEKPTFREMPDDIQANVDDTVELKCRASGDPTPVIQWRKDDGRVPFGRARQLDDGSLRIEKVQVSDDGVYACVAENSAGSVEAVGRLSVQTLPSFLVTPKNMSVGRGRMATLQCVVTGNPPPTVFWSKGKEQLLMFPHQDHGRFLVSEDGTMRIQNVDYHDEGTYVCQALNSLSNSKVSTVSAVLTVLDQDDRPPPIIMVGPQNQTLEPKEVALFTCQADGDPQPSIRWYKDGRHLINSDPRIAILNSGMLQISDVRVTDAGMYTCKAISETGETDWIVSLTVSKQGPYHRIQKSSAFPGAPSKPRVSDITDTTVHLTWQPSDQFGQSQVYGYVVEYFSPHMYEGWQVASDSVSRDSYTVKDLRPDTKYLFLVRARNFFGLSPPSPLSDYVTTRERRHSFTVSMARPEITKEFASLKIELKPVEVINSTSIHIRWEVSTSASLSAIEGYIVNYTHVTDLDPVKYGDSQLMRIVDPYQFKASITNLIPFSWYEICVRAYARDVLSACSNSVSIPTKESVPSAAPENIVIHKEGNSFHVRWSPPAKQHQNGDIKGYDIYCVAEESNQNCSTTVGGRDSSATIFGVDTEVSYKIRVAAKTVRGRGAWSKDFIMGPERTNITSEPWFVWMLVGTIGGTLWLALCLFSTWLCRRRRRDKKNEMAQNGMYSTVPVHKSDDSNRGGIVARDDAMYVQKEGNIHGPYGGLHSDLTSLLECGLKDGVDSGHGYSAVMSLPQMKTFCQRPGPALVVAPYATTTLISKGGNSVSRPNQSVAETGFRPINHAYVHSSASGSGDSCHKPDMRSSDSTTDSSRPNTGHYSYAGCPHDLCDGLTSPGSESESLTTDENGMPVERHKYSKIGGCSICRQGKQAMFNWAELLPPPPEHPPASEFVSPSDEPSHKHHHNNNNNDGIADQPRFVDSCGLISPVSKISACSCPIPHDRILPHLHVNIPYSDFEYPIHSGQNHDYPVDLSGAYQECGSCGGTSGSGGSNYASDRPYSPKNVNTLPPQNSDTLKSCHNCGSSIQPSSGHQLLRSSSPQNPHLYHYHHLLHHHHHHPPLNADKQCSPCTMDLDKSKGRLYPQVGCMYPQGTVATLYTQTETGQCPYSTVYPCPPAALHGYRIPLIEAGNKRNSSDLDKFQGQVYYPGVEGHERGHVGPMCQSSLIDSKDVQMDFRKRQESQTSEGVADYAGESDMEAQRATDCHTTDSSMNGYGHASDADISAAVARASNQSGFSVPGSTASCSRNNNNKKYKKHKPSARPCSPYSTDSNFSTVAHKPYPKSERKKQLLEQGRKYSQQKDNQDLATLDTGTEIDIPGYRRPLYPTFPLPCNRRPAQSTALNGFKDPVALTDQWSNRCESPTVLVSQSSSSDLLPPTSVQNIVTTE